MSTEPGEHMFAEERKQKIIDYVNEHQKAKVPELCQEFNVSSATIRNDLRDLEHSGALMRTHGGAMRNTKTGYESVMAERSSINLEGKQRIAARAIDYIENNDTIILDVGTTTLELARLIHRRRNITVITNDLKIALVLEDVSDCTIVMLGGIIRKQYHSTIGPTPIEFLEDFVVDKAFMGTNSFSLEKGATTPDLMQAQVKKKMIQIAGCVYLLCEGEKLGRSSFAQFAEVEEIDVIITDSISDETRSQYEENGFDVITG